MGGGSGVDPSTSGAIPIRVVTLQFSPALGAFDARPLDALVADKEVLGVREHFFAVDGMPFLACLMTLRPASRKTAVERKTPDAA